MIVRSYLYVPADRPERFSKALASGSDAVVLDLEDAVALAAKEEALIAVSELLSHEQNSDSEIWVRINVGERGLSDLNNIAGSNGLSGVIVPKATLESLGLVLDAAEGTRVIALIESAQGLLQLSDLANLAGVAQFAFGEIDLAADLAMTPSPEGREMESLRVNLVVTSAAFGLLPPIGPVWIDISDHDGLAVSTEHLRRLGFGSRQAIHPNQIDAINAAMSPTAKEVEHATHLLELARRANGAVCVDEKGRMIDEAVLRSARRLTDSQRSRT